MLDESIEMEKKWKSFKKNNKNNTSINSFLDLYNSKNFTIPEIEKNLPKYKKTPSPEFLFLKSLEYQVFSYKDII
jgi:hypothetical protein